jgi:membrane-associated protease RseP (regulator of RpoE activity)
MNGRLTLNPLVHLDPMGSLMLVFAGFGWAKSVEVNPYALSRRSPAAMMWVSLAGPTSNLLMAIIAAIPFQLGLVSLSNAFPVQGQIMPTLSMLLFEFVYINLILMLFNLIPIAPLDGEKIMYCLVSPSIQRYMDVIRPYGPITPARRGLPRPDNWVQYDWHGARTSSASVAVFAGGMIRAHFYRRASSGRRRGQPARRTTLTWRRHLPPNLWGFFLQLQPNDQQHSLHVLQALLIGTKITPVYARRPCCTILARLACPYTFGSAC